MIGSALREAVASGRWDAVPMGDDVALDSSSERGRVRLAGRAAVLDHLAGPGPGEVLAWDERSWPTGAAITFEWRGASGTDRRRWYVTAQDGRIVRLFSYAARVRSAGAVTIPHAVLDRLGPSARRAPLAHGGNSGAALERVELGDGTALIAKRVGPASDWLGRITGDHGRTALLHADGAFDRLDGVVDHGIVAVEPDGDGWWVLMRDLSATFLGDERRLTRDESRRFLRAGAELHAAFAGAPPAAAATLEARLSMMSPATADLERTSTDLLPKQLDAAWDAFADSVGPDVADAVLRTARDPAPLAGALRAAGPVTLLHGDLRDDNLGLRGDDVVLLDWDLATAGTPTVEFAWYLCHDAWRIDATHDEIEADFRAAEPGLVADEVELGMLSGLVQYGWLFGHSARIHPDPAERAWATEELQWWEARTRAALERLGGAP